MARHENVLKKYNIREDELKTGIDIVSKKLGDICNVAVLLAVTELLVNGDIECP